MALCLHCVAVGAEEGTEGICRKAGVVSWHLEETLVLFLSFLKQRTLWVKYGRGMTEDFFFSQQTFRSFRLN